MTTLHEKRSVLTVQNSNSIKLYFHRGIGAMRAKNVTLKWHTLCLVAAVVCQNMDCFSMTLTFQGNGGGIVKQPKDVKPQVQAIGNGMTVYYLVDDLDKVPLSGPGWIALPGVLLSSSRCSRRFLSSAAPFVVIKGMMESMLAT